MSKPRRRSSPRSSPPVKRDGIATPVPAVRPQAPVPCPAVDDRDGWRAYWRAQNQPWRTEPEIDQKRQAELGQRRAIVPNIEKGIYPFKGMKLGRADVEWLLATHENGRGPVNWSDESQWERVGLDLRGTDLREVDLSGLLLARLRGGLNRSEWLRATFEQGKIAQTQFEKANLSLAHLEGACLYWAHLEGADLSRAHLEKADLYGAHLEGAYFHGAHLEGTSLRNAIFDPTSIFRYVLVGSVLLSDIHWGGMNLSFVNWAQITILGDELEARQPKRWDGRMKNIDDRFSDYRRAARAYRQISVVLQSQGLNEEAARFAYRGQVIHRYVLWIQIFKQGVTFRQGVRTFGSWLFSWFLFLLAGYGYRPGRSFLAYFLVITGFAAAYYLLGHTVGPALSPLGAFVFSMTSFHGRGFFPGGIKLDDPLTVLAAIEALVGLIIEVTFIATLTRRFFGQ